MAVTNRHIVLTLRDELGRPNITEDYIEMICKAYRKHPIWDDTWSDHDICGIQIGADNMLEIELIFYSHQVAYETFRFDPELFDHPPTVENAINFMKEGQYEGEN